MIVVVCAIGVVPAEAAERTRQTVKPSSATAASPAAASPALAMSTEGTITELDAQDGTSYLKLTTSENLVETLVLDSRTTKVIGADGLPAMIGALQRGQRISVKYREASGRQVADVITLLRIAPPASAASAGSTAPPRAKPSVQSSTPIEPAPSSTSAVAAPSDTTSVSPEESVQTTPVSSSSSSSVESDDAHPRGERSNGTSAW